MEVQHVIAFGDSLPIVLWITDVYQCLEGSLNIYLDKCIDAIAYFVEFQIRRIPKHDNNEANMLAQQASGYDISGHNFHIKERLVWKDTTATGLPKPARPVSETS